MAERRHAIALLDHHDPGVRFAASLRGGAAGKPNPVGAAPLPDVERVPACVRRSSALLSDDR
jgi:hypothetical protein